MINKNTNLKNICPKCKQPVSKYRAKYEIPSREELARLSKWAPSMTAMAAHYKVSQMTIKNWLRNRKVLAPEKMALADFNTGFRAKRRKIVNGRNSTQHTVSC